MRTYLRLARVGNVFTAYGSNVTTSAGPQGEADWTILGSTGDIVSGGAPVQVGYGGYRTTGAAGNKGDFDFIRNWIAQQ